MPLVIGLGDFQLQDALGFYGNTVGFGEAPKPAPTGPAPQAFDAEAADVIKGFEGYRDAPYWDRNAYRVGYGSDTITREDGTVVPVGKSDRVTRADAERDLARRIPQFQRDGVVPYIGEDVWNALPKATQAVITSVAYNYGSLKELPTLTAAIKSGDAAAIAEAIRARRGDNGGVNQERRDKEAAMVFAEPGKPAPAQDPNAVVADGMYEPRDGLGLYAGGTNPLEAAKPDFGVEGMVAAGNIDLGARPVVLNADGSYSTVLSMSFEEDGKEVLIPKISDDGRELSDKEAVALYHETGKHLGMFKSAGEADAYAQNLHESQEKLYADAASRARTARVEEAVAKLNEGEPGRYALVDADTVDAWRTDWQAKNGSKGIVDDTLKLLDVGFAGLEQTAREAIGKIPGVGEKLVELGDAVDQWRFGAPDNEKMLNGVIENKIATLTPEMRDARAKQWWDAKNGRLGTAWLDPRSYYAGVVESLPATVATMAPAMALARASYVGMLARGLGTKTAAAAAARTALVSGALLEGGQGGAESSLSVRNAIGKIPREQLLQTDAVQALLAQGLDEDAAIKAVTEDATTQAFIMGGVVTGAFGGFGDRFLAKLISEGVGGTIAKRMVSGALRGFVSEGILEEAPQEAGAQLAQNLALKNTVVPNQDVTEGVANAALGGVAVGGAMGVTMGAAGGVARPADELASPQVDEVAPAGSSSEPQALAAVKGPLAQALDYAHEQLGTELRRSAEPGEREAPSPPVAGRTTSVADIPVPLSPIDSGSAPAPGKDVVVEVEGLGRFTAKIDSYVDGEHGPEALVVDSDGVVLQVPVDALKTAKLTDALVSDLDKQVDPPVEREKSGAPTSSSRQAGSSTVQFPDAKLADVYDFGKQLKQSKGLSRTLGENALKAAEIDPQGRQRLADELGVLPERVNEIAEDYRYRTDRAIKAAGNTNSLPINMHGLNPDKLKTWQQERRIRQLEADRAAHEIAQEPEIATELDATAATIDAPAHEAATSPLNDRPEPSQAQKEAGNYKLGHFVTGGLDISIENPAGSDRKGVDKSGKPWSVTMKSHYGYFKGTVGRDKDHIDVFVKKGTGDLSDDAPVFVVDQVVDGKFDEHKVMLGYGTAGQATNAYKANYAKGWKGLGAISSTTLGEFKGWLRDGDTSAPFRKSEQEYRAPMPAQQSDRLSVAETRSPEFVADSIDENTETYKLGGEHSFDAEEGDLYYIRNSTLLHYAKSFGVPTDGRSRSDIWADMQAKGAKSRQSGDIISHDLTSAQVANQLPNRFPIGKSDGPVSEKVFAAFKSALIAHPEQVEPVQQGWSFRINQPLGTDEVQINLTVYGAGGPIVSGLYSKSGRYGNAGPAPKSEFERFMKKFVADHPVPGSGSGSAEQAPTRSAATTATRRPIVDQDEDRKSVV